MTIVELLDAGYAVLRAHARIMLAAGAVTAAVTSLLPWLIDRAVNGNPPDGALTSLLGGGHTPWYALVQWLARDFGALVLAAIASAVLADDLLGRPVSWGSVRARLRPVLLPAAAVIVVGTAAPYLGLVAFVLPGLATWAFLGLAPAALVFERGSARSALARGWRLSAGAWARVWWTRALATFAAWLVAYVLALPFGIGLGAAVFQDLAGHHTPGALTQLIVVLAQTVSGAVIMPVLGATLALLYADRRYRTEALDIQLAGAAGATT